jgi:hypothetical protein
LVQRAARFIAAPGIRVPAEVSASQGATSHCAHSDLARGDHFFPGTPGGCFGWLQACLGVGAATPRALEGRFPRLAPASPLGAASSQKGLEAVCLDSL